MSNLGDKEEEIERKLLTLIKIVIKNIPRPIFFNHVINKKSIPKFSQRVKRTWSFEETQWTHTTVLEYVPTVIKTLPFSPFVVGD